VRSGTVAATDTAVIVDASVVIKWYAAEGREPHQREALEILRRFTRGELAVHAPDLIRYEVGNALARAAPDPEAGYRSFLNLPIRFHHPDASMLLRALECRRRRGGSVYDAVYGVLAETLGVPLVTTDAGQARRCGGGAVMLEVFAAESS